MTFKELKLIVNSAAIDDNARVYLEQPLGDEVYLQMPVEATRCEINDVAAYFIITGKMGDQV